jgi:hypothetical protein
VPAYENALKLLRELLRWYQSSTNGAGGKRKSKWQPVTNKYWNKSFWLKVIL